MRSTKIHNLFVFINNMFFDHAASFWVKGMHNITKCSIFTFT